MTRGTPACLECGSCCFSTIAEYVRVVGSDYARLGERAPDLTRFVGNRCYMRMYEDGHCAALHVDRENGRFVCSIYESRPEVCRELERGSPSCAAEIHEKRARPLRLLGRATR